MPAAPRIRTLRTVPTLATMRGLGTGRRPHSGAVEPPAPVKPWGFAPAPNPGACGPRPLPDVFDSLRAVRGWSRSSPRPWQGRLPYGIFSPSGV